MTLKLKRCPKCRMPGYVRTVVYTGYGVKANERYQNQCMSCGWQTKKTRFEWQADLAWNRGKAEVVQR